MKNSGLLWCTVTTEYVVCDGQVIKRRIGQHFPQLVISNHQDKSQTLYIRAARLLLKLWLMMFKLLFCVTASLTLVGGLPQDHKGAVTCPSGDPTVSMCAYEASKNIDDYCTKWDGYDLSDSSNREIYFQEYGSVLNVIEFKWNDEERTCAAKGAKYIIKKVTPWCAFAARQIVLGFGGKIMLTMLTTRMYVNAFFQNSLPSATPIRKMPHSAAWSKKGAPSTPSRSRAARL